MDNIRLSSGMASFPAHPLVQEAAVQAIRNLSDITFTNEGLATLREAIAERYQTYNGTTVSADALLVTPGVRQAVYNVLANVLSPGDEVILPAPYWFGFPDMIRQAGGHPVFLPTTPETGYTVSPQSLARLITPRTRLFLFCNPHNPTGRVYTPAEMAGLEEVLQEHPHVYVLSDEIYDLISYGDRVHSWYERENFRERLFVVNGFSKSFALTKWRVGYLLPPAKYYTKCADYQDVTVSGQSPVLQEAALAALRHRTTILPPMLETLTRHRELLGQALHRLGLPFVNPAGTYYIFADFSPLIVQQQPDWRPAQGSISFFEDLGRTTGVEILAGDSSGAPGFGRVSFAVEEELLQKALDQLVGSANVGNPGATR